MYVINVMISADVAGGDSRIKWADIATVESTRRMGSSVEVSTGGDGRGRDPQLSLVSRAISPFPFQFHETSQYLINNRLIQLYSVERQTRHAPATQQVASQVIIAREVMHSL